MKRERCVCRNGCNKSNFFTFSYNSLYSSREIATYNFSFSKQSINALLFDLLHAALVIAQIEQTHWKIWFQLQAYTVRWSCCAPGLHLIFLYLTAARCDQFGYKRGFYVEVCELQSWRLSRWKVCWSFKLLEKFLISMNSSRRQGISFSVNNQSLRNN